jgi:hypothetical protein
LKQQTVTTHTYISVRTERHNSTMEPKGTERQTQILANKPDMSIRKRD